MTKISTGRPALYQPQASGPRSRNIRQKGRALKTLARLQALAKQAREALSVGDRRRARRLLRQIQEEAKAFARSIRPTQSTDESTLFGSIRSIASFAGRSADRLEKGDLAGARDDAAHVFRFAREMQRWVRGDRD